MEKYKLTLNPSSGVTLQTAATSPWMFLAGRVINFAMTGFCVVVTPIYQAECAPPELRGMIASTLQFQIMFGSLIATLVNYGTQTMEGQASWMIPIGMWRCLNFRDISVTNYCQRSPIRRASDDHRITSSYARVP